LHRQGLKHRHDEDVCSLCVPKEWRRLGFSGTFTTEATLTDVDDLDAFEAKLPDRVAFGSNSGWLALRLNRDVDPPTVVLVRDDAAALVEAFTTRRPV
jgi:hypothetical protein